MKNTKPIIEHFDSIDALLRATDERALIPTGRRFDSITDAKRIKKHARFHGVESLEEARELLRHGYKEGTKALKTKANTAIDATDERARYSSSVVGFAPIVPNAIQGLPNSMMRRDVTPIKTKVIRLLVDVTYPGVTSRTDIERYGANVLNHIAALERAGYRVEVRAIFYSMQSPRDEAVTFLLKRADLPVDVRRLSFPLIHQSFLRVFLFRWYERLPEGTVDFGHGYSLSTTSYYEARKKLEAAGLADASTVYVNIKTDVEHELNRFTKKK